MTHTATRNLTKMENDLEPGRSVITDEWLQSIAHVDEVLGNKTFPGHKVHRRRFDISILFLFIGLAVGVVLTILSYTRI